MTVSLTLTSEDEAALIAQAKAQGVSVDALLRKAVLQIISANTETEIQVSPPLSPKEFDEAFEEAAEMILEGVPPLRRCSQAREHLLL